jgi:hypothetical protein
VQIAFCDPLGIPIVMKPICDYVNKLINEFGGLIKVNKYPLQPAQDSNTCGAYCVMLIDSIYHNKMTFEQFLAQFDSNLESNDLLIKKQLASYTHQHSV